MQQLVHSDFPPQKLLVHMAGDNLDCILLARVDVAGLVHGGVLANANLLTHGVELVYTPRTSTHPEHLKPFSPLFLAQCIQIVPVCMLT